MSVSIIIVICGLLLLSYVFDITSSKTRIPSVLLLLILGWGVKQLAVFFKISFPGIEDQLPAIGTIGLILIVLDGSLELEVHRSNLTLIKKSALVALIPMLLLSFGLATTLYYFDPILSYKDCLVNAIPLSVISSAVAISSAGNLMASQREFIIYESSLSDIFGVIFFNFVAFQDEINMSSIGYFILDIIYILVISLTATLGLAFLLSKIKHKVKFAPIIILIILIYFISKIYNLPALIFILLFGILMGNLDQIKKLKYFKNIQTNTLNKEVDKFKELTVEFTFLIRTLFFILFGFIIKTNEIFNLKSIVWAVGIVVAIFIVRALVLKILKINMHPLLFISPRGLITLLLFLSIPQSDISKIINNSLMIQVVILTAIIMMFGLMFSSNKKEA